MERVQARGGGRGSPWRGYRRLFFFSSAVKAVRGMCLGNGISELVIAYVIRGT